MHILLVNDDGIDAPGLSALREIFPARFGPLSVVAPATQQSAVGHAITLDGPVTVEKLAEDDGTVCFTTSGTPADCVKLALGVLLKKPPSLVVSGINEGANLGMSLVHSGTVAAAIQAAVSGIAAVAVSLDRTDEPDYLEAARIAADLIEALLKNGLRAGQAVNINIPARPAARIRGVRVVRQCPLAYRERFDDQRTAEGRRIRILGDTQPVPDGVLTDVEAFHEGYVTITPVSHDLTDEAALTEMGKAVLWKEGEYR